jgi:hypothetical protein
MSTGTDGHLVPVETNQSLRSKIATRVAGVVWGSDSGGSSVVMLPASPSEELVRTDMLAVLEEGLPNSGEELAVTGAVKLPAGHSSGLPSDVSELFRDATVTGSESQIAEQHSSLRKRAVSDHEEYSAKSPRSEREDDQKLERTLRQREGPAESGSSGPGRDGDTLTAKVTDGHGSGPNGQTGSDDTSGVAVGDPDDSSRPTRAVPRPRETRSLSYLWGSLMQPNLSMDPNFTGGQWCVDCTMGIEGRVLWELLEASTSTGLPCNARFGCQHIESDGSLSGDSRPCRREATELYSVLFDRQVMSVLNPGEMLTEHMAGCAWCPVHLEEIVRAVAMSSEDEAVGHQYSPWSLTPVGCQIPTLGEVEAAGRVAQLVKRTESELAKLIQSERAYIFQTSGLLSKAEAAESRNSDLRGEIERLEAQMKVREIELISEQRRSQLSQQSRSAASEQQLTSRLAQMEQELTSARERALAIEGNWQDRESRLHGEAQSMQKQQEKPVTNGLRKSGSRRHKSSKKRDQTGNARKL